MVLLHVEAQVDARFGLFGDSTSVGARYVHGLRQMLHWLRIILDAADYTPRCEAHVEYPISVNLEIVLILTQDRCTVCAKRTIGLENCFGHTDGTPTCRGSSACSFWSIWR